MKQKYLIIKNDEKNELIIREFTEGEHKGIFHLLCESTFSYEIIEPAILKGNKALISILRTKNMYPPICYAEKIAESVVKLYNSQNDQSMEIFFDDKDFISKNLKEATATNDKKDELIEFDELLEGKPDNLDNFLEDDNNIIKNTTSAINLEENAPPDIEDDN